MSNVAVAHRLTAEEFLAWDAGQSLRHEFVAVALWAEMPLADDIR
jgi:hypothetical protein